MGAGVSMAAHARCCCCQTVLYYALCMCIGYVRVMMEMIVIMMCLGTSLLVVVLGWCVGLVAVWVLDASLDTPWKGLALGHHSRWRLLASAVSHVISQPSLSGWHLLRTRCASSRVPQGLPHSNLPSRPASLPLCVPAPSLD